MGATKTETSGTTTTTTYTDYNKAHKKAIRAENKVNGNTRNENTTGGPDTFTETTGSTAQQVTPTSTGGITVTKTPIP